MTHTFTSPYLGHEPKAKVMTPLSLINTKIYDNMKKEKKKWSFDIKNDGVNKLSVLNSTQTMGPKSMS